MKPILTPHDGQGQFGLSGIRTFDHSHASPELYHCATGMNIIYLGYQKSIQYIHIQNIQANQICTFFLIKIPFCVKM